MMIMIITSFASIARNWMTVLCWTHKPWGFIFFQTRSMLSINACLKTQGWHWKSSPTMASSSHMTPAARLKFSWSQWGHGARLEDPWPTSWCSTHPPWMLGTSCQRQWYLDCMRSHAIPWAFVYVWLSSVFLCSSCNIQHDMIQNDI